MNINIRNTNKAIREGKPSTLKQADRFQKPSIQESKSLFCEMCGEENPFANKFCQNCGIDLDYVKKTYFDDLDSGRSRHIPPKIRYEVYLRDKGQCVRCGATDDIQFDHILPFSKGGAHTVENLQLLCRKCNQEKTDRIDG